MMRRCAIWGAYLAACFLGACGPEAETEESVGTAESSLRVGDPAFGREIVLNNGTETTPYLSCGVPTGVVEVFSWFGIDLIGTGPTLPERKRGMADLPYNITLAKTRTGLEVVTTGCLMCHASKLGGQLIIGLPNPNLDFTSDGSFFGLRDLAFDGLSLFLTPEENVEMARYRRVQHAETFVPRPHTIGANPADVIFGVISAFRDKDTLAWQPTISPEANLDIAPVWSDIPAWWNMYRRDRMFYSGFGQGAHARIMMSASLVCVEDAAEAQAIDELFPHVEAFIKSLRPPKYTTVARRSIDSVRAARGRTLYMNTCSGCHGDSENNVPPAPSVPQSVVGTDPAYAVNTSVQGDGTISYFFDFFNESWYGQYGEKGTLVRNSVPSYSPPPLGGIWATAPYFHNGSVPTLEAVLNPALRPAKYRRSFNPDEYDFVRCGWPFQVVSQKGTDVTVYDSSRYGFGNGGHTFAAGLTSEQRRDLLEYLKTL